MAFGKYNKASKRTIKEAIDLDKLGEGFKDLKDYIGKEIVVDGFYFTDKGKYGKQVVLVADNSRINIPKRYVDQFEAIKNDDEDLKALLDGKCKLVNIRAIDSKNGKTTAFDFADC